MFVDRWWPCGQLLHVHPIQGNIYKYNLSQSGTRIFLIITFQNSAFLKVFLQLYIDFIMLSCHDEDSCTLNTFTCFHLPWAWLRGRRSISPLENSGRVTWGYIICHNISILLQRMIRYIHILSDLFTIMIQLSFKPPHVTRTHRCTHLSV